MSRHTTGRGRGPTPIPTVFLGIKFRSRSEARFAAFFEALGLPWEYEPEGYRTDGLNYLPDFRVGKAFVEIKPDRDLSDTEQEKMIAFGSKAPLVIIKGRPWPDGYSVEVVKDGQIMRTQLVFTDCPLCGTVGFGIAVSSWNGQSFHCPTCVRNPRKTRDAWVEGDRVFCVGPEITHSKRIQAAYEAASSERFGT